MARKQPRAHVGTSGWIYEDWAGPFYPEEVRSTTDRLAHYAQSFDTVEINSTFYRLASRKAAAAWQEAVPPGFRMVAKGSQFITHRLKLNRPEPAVSRFFEPLEPLTSLAVVLWQFPQNMPRDLDRLENFLKVLPKHVRHAFEFRHEQFWDDDVASLLARYNAAFCAVSHPSLPSDVVATTDFVYVRFHGLGERLYNYLYSDEELAPWAERVREQLRGCAREAYAFFNNDWHANAVTNGRRFRELLGLGELSRRENGRRRATG